VSLAAAAPAEQQRSARPAPSARASCLYEGFVRHRRFGAPSDELRYRLFMAYVDLDELPELFDGSLLWSARRPALAWFRRADHLGDARTPLREAVRALVAERSAISLRSKTRIARVPDRIPIGIQIVDRGSGTRGSWPGRLLFRRLDPTA